MRTRPPRFYTVSMKKSASFVAPPPLHQELSPCPDPWDVARKLSHLPHLLMLDSADATGPQGRFSYIMAEPYEWECVEEERFGGGATFDNLGRYIANPPRPTLSGLPPFQGGLAFLLGYDLNTETEPSVPLPTCDEFAGPRYCLGLYDWVVSFDHRSKRAWVVVHGRPEIEKSRKRWLAFDKMTELLNALHDNSVRQPAWKPNRPRGPLAVGRLSPQFPLAGSPGVTGNFSRGGYLKAVERAVEYVHAGDVFQVNIAQRLLAPLKGPPLDLYGRLRARNPAPFACYFDLGQSQILSASPERFLQVTPDGAVGTTPIKGTRPRGTTPEEDAELIRDLTSNPKDRAENIMIVDLLRNDLGRVCDFGSVEVAKLCEVETYPFVHHLVSEVRGRLRTGQTPFDLLKAAFPGGSVTGAPKVRAMQIIAELEPTARGAYCGSIGYLGFNGCFDSNILIRTFTAQQGWVQFPVGGGIVADSEPAKEYDETLHKAAGLLRALEP